MNILQRFVAKIFRIPERVFVDGVLLVGEDRMLISLTAYEISLLAYCVDLELQDNTGNFHDAELSTLKRLSTELSYYHLDLRFPELEVFGKDQ